MAIRTEVQRDVGHPWDSRPGFDLLSIEADTQTELDNAVQAAERKFWQAWLIGINEATAKPGGVLYKPCDALAPWSDCPKQPHPGHIRNQAGSPDPVAILT